MGPEVSVAAAARLRGGGVVLVGDPAVLDAAAEVVGVSRNRLVRLAAGASPPRGKIGVVAAGPALAARDFRPGAPSRSAGRAQLAYVDAAYALCRDRRGVALVSGPVSKAAIARSGAPGAAGFLGHTEWLRDADGAGHATMCFAAEGMVTSLVTTHLPIARVPAAITASGVRDATVDLAALLGALGVRRPRIAVASLNPHAGESELLGTEERRAIVPGIRRARAKLGRRATLVGPVGAETAYRLMAAGRYDGVVAMYHDQATIPMKLTSFGEAVNVTMGLSVARTSVDHGTAYDIAWRGEADPAGMLSAMALGARLAGARPVRVGARSR
ncbi:MAG: 4-hydroxythreonine-4-phosphate dehydrogenase PdxA [Deltaproteobacteria bacterium]|nr:4-hydroxythreonine-4-phosphate dehydrogenase PdxA [Deltaproteobacteria bacterium]